jgi:hypothetical protein
MKKLIGFATQFYTLWEYSCTPRYGGNVVMNGVPPPIVGYNHEYFYLKNISMDIEKVKELYPGVTIDEDLRGQSRSFERYERVERPVDCFNFGKLEGQKIAEATDVWQLKRVCWMVEGQSGDPNRRRQVLARRRLVELGELVKYPHIIYKYEDLNWGKRDDEGKILPENRQDVPYRVNYATPKFVEIEEGKKRKAERPYYFNDGERLTLSIKLVRRFGFDTAFGYTTICFYITDDGKEVQYMGSNPPEISDTEFIKVKATIKHKEYKGIKDTNLQRIKPC